jgi:hypothetical protein
MSLGSPLAGTLVDHVADATVPDAWYATDGVHIQASADGGCSWLEIFALPETPSAEQPLAGGTARITGLAASGGTVAAAVRTLSLSAPVPRPAWVLASDDAGETWKAGGPLGPAEAPVVSVAPGDRARIYVGTAGAVHRSTDGGATFESANLVPQDAAQAGDREVVALVVDPQDPDRVWATTAGVSHRSVDGGVTWTVPPKAPVGRLVGPVVTRARGAAAARVVYAQRDEQDHLAKLWKSRDGGESFTSSDVSGVSGRPLGLAADGDEVVLTTASLGDNDKAGVYRSTADGKVESIDEFGLAPLGSIEKDARPASKFYFGEGLQLAVFEQPVPSDDGPLTSPPGGSPGSEPGPDPPKGPGQSSGVDRGGTSTLTPKSSTVKIPVGETAEIAYELSLTARPTPLDVFFVLDTSASTHDYIEGLKKGIDRLSKGLAAQGLDVHLGLADYQSTGEDGYRYRRGLDLTPDTRAMTYQLSRIAINGGSEPGFTAIHQAVTGAGIPEVKTGLEVKPGLGASWRRGAVHVAVQIADEPFYPDPDGADRAKAGAALFERDVRYVGIEVLRSEVNEVANPDVGAEPVHENPLCNSFPDSIQEDPDWAHRTLRLRCQMEALARISETRAVNAGIDCNGDGLVDTQKGELLVCSITGPKQISGISKPLEALLLAARLERPVSLRLAGTPPIPVDVLPAADYSHVDLRKDNKLTYRARFSCPVQHAGKAVEVPLEARIADLVVADASATVECGDVVKNIPVPPPPIPQPAPPPAPAPAPQPMPVPAVPAPSVHVAVAAAAPPPPPARVPTEATAGAMSPASAPASASSSAGATTPAGAGAGSSSQALAIAGDGDNPGDLAVVRVDVDDQPAVGEASLSFAREELDPSQSPAAWLFRLLGLAGVMWPVARATRGPRIAPGSRRARL